MLSSSLFINMEALMVIAIDFESDLEHNGVNDVL